MKALLISIHPKWCKLIASGKKTVEIRKTRPKKATPFKVFIYCTKQKVPDHNPSAGKVVGEFWCDEIFPIKVFENGSIQDYMRYNIENSCVPYDDIAGYIGKDKPGYGWHISDLVIYDNPKDLDK